MKKFFRNVLLSLAGAFLFSPAFALTTTPTYSIKTFDTGSYTGITITGAATPGAFSEQANFTLGSGIIAGSVGTLDLSFLGFNSSAISNLNVQLYKIVSGVNTLIGQGNAFTVSGNQSASNYLAVITGTAAPGATSVYQAMFTSFPGSVSAVPEPETYLMMLIGLAIIGNAAYRNRRKNRIS